MKKFLLPLLVTILLFSCKKEAGSISLTTSDDSRYLTDHTFTIGIPPCAPADLSGYRFNCPMVTIPFAGTNFKAGMQIIAQMWYKPVDASTGTITLPRFVAAYTDKKGSFSFSFNPSSYPAANWGLDIYQAGKDGSNPILYGEVFFQTY